VKLAISSSTPLVGKTRTITRFLGTDFLAGATILGSFESAMVIMRIIRQEWSQDLPCEMQAIGCAKLIIGVARIRVIVV
jgi:predicted membrane protein